MGIDSRAANKGRSLHDMLGYSSSDPFLLHASVRENLVYGNPNLPQLKKMVEAARLAEANKFILSLPEGFDTVIGGRGHSLSDGQRQRLGLARLFLADPDVLVLGRSVFCNGSRDGKPGARQPLQRLCRSALFWPLVTG